MNVKRQCGVLLWRAAVRPAGAGRGAVRPASFSAAFKGQINLYFICVNAGRFFDGRLYDLLELGVERYTSIRDFGRAAEVQIGNKVTR